MVPPFVVHVTAVFVVPETAAVMEAEAPVVRLALDGVTETVTVGLGGGFTVMTELAVPPAAAVAVTV